MVTSPWFVPLVTVPLVNILNSVKTAAVNTAVNGTLNAVTGKIAGKIVPTNNGWVKPQKFISSFAGNYAVKSEFQTFIQSNIISGKDVIANNTDQIMRERQQPTITIVPDVVVG